MDKAIEAFRTNILRVRNLGGLYKALLSLTTPVVDVSDMLRAQLVLGVSALDHYVHELTISGMLEVFDGKRTSTPSFLNFRVSMNSVLGGFVVSGTSVWFESEIRERHSFLTFQQPDRIADAVRLFSDVKLWHEVSAKLSMTEQEMKERLKLIVERRNKIAHEADMDPSYPGSRWPISEASVNTSLDFIANLCQAIHATVV